MPNQARPQMCLSTEEHDNRVLDVSLHYFGCLRVSARQHFYNKLPENSRRRIRRKARRIVQQRTELECQPKTRAGALLKDFKESLSDWRGVNGWASVEENITPRLPDDLDNSVE